MKEAFQNFFVYQTPKIVRVVDRKIGLFYYFWALVVFVYIFAYVLLINESYYESQYQLGKSSIRAFGSFMGEGSDGTTRVFDIGDIVRDIDETSGIFIATNVSVTSNQQLEYCEIDTCSSDDDCVDNPPFEDATCLSSGYCQSYTWCPQNLDSSSTVSYAISNITDMNLMYFNVINFGSDEEKVNVYYTTTESNATVYYPNSGANAMTLSQILSYTGADITAIMQYGAIVEIDFYYDCVMKQSSCDPTIQFSYLGGSDNQTIYTEETIQYYVSDELYRDYYNYMGIRIIYNIHGRGKIFSYCNVILQVASLLALLNIVTLLSDWFMLNFPGLAEEHRTMYYKYKIENSEDFSNLQEKLNLINEEQSKKSKKIKRDRQAQREGLA